MEFADHHADLSILFICRCRAIRTDGAYYAPLKKLALRAGTQLILGVVHYTDGVEGSRKRIATAERYVKDFDVATECGFGRRDASTIPELLRIHRELCAN